MISIILPVYNGEKYISAAIQSVLKQTYNNWELIVVNDGSKDNTSKICERFASLHENIKLYNNTNQGVFAARNFGVSVANGNYITFLDADDMYEVNRLEIMSKVLEENFEVDLVYSGYRFLDENIAGDEIYSRKLFLKDQFVDDILFNQKRTCVWRCMLKSEIAKSLKFRSIKYTEDLFYVLDYIQKCRKIVMLEDKLYVYKRDNKDSMTNNTRQEKYISDFVAIPIFMYEYMKKNGYVSEIYRKKIADEYAYAAIRVRRATTYSRFVTEMKKKEFRKGIEFAENSKCDLKKKIIFFLIKKEIYLPFRLVK